jgi:hypothetical protein
MSALYKQIVDSTPAGEISDSSMEFKFDGASRRYMRSKPQGVGQDIHHFIIALHSEHF